MNEMRNTKYESRVASREPRYGFTLAELVVAIGIMAVVILFSGMVFKTSIGSYRIATAQAEIVQKFRAITQQLDSDFRGIRKDAPLFIWFQLDPNDPNKRLDQIMFFADGDFQSIQTYNTNVNPIIPAASGSPIASNLARIYYGQARSVDPRDISLKFPFDLRPVDRVLSRRQHLSVANPDTGNRYMEYPRHVSPPPSILITTLEDDSFEHDTNSLSQWQAELQDGNSVTNTIAGCMGNLGNYPTINLKQASTLHLLMAEKVGSFAVQWSYNYADNFNRYVYWWPNIDPNGNLADSDFGTSYMNLNAFGFYFNTAVHLLGAPPNWFKYGDAAGVYYPGSPGNLETDKPVFPQALKFTFTLYDSRGVFKDGQTFTHIVYIGD
jgi:prepilin-type N-terminal cleavage/methylation domain-containing protein